MATNDRRLEDLVSVGPAMMRDFELLGVRTVEQSAATGGPMPVVVLEPQAQSPLTPTWRSADVGGLGRHATRES